MIKEIDELKKQITIMLNNKCNYSNNYPIPEEISSKAKKALIDMENNNDNSFSVEMFLRRQNNLDSINIIYRGRKIDGFEFWKNVVIYAKSLKAIGIKKGDEVPVIMSNSPEYYYLFIALDLIGAKMNIVGPWFDKEYLKEIFEGSKCKYIFATDDINDNIIYAINNAKGIEYVYMSSLTDSFIKNKDGEKINPYVEIDNAFNHFNMSIDDFKQVIKKTILSFNSFTSLSNDYNGQFVEDMCLDDPCVITYTSGTTKPGFPKACIHSNRNYFSLARFKRPDVAPMPPLKKLTVFAHLPSYTQSVLTSAYTDTLYMGWTTILEPYYELEFYPYALLINKPEYTVETPEYEKYVAKLLDTQWKTIKMPERMVVDIAGQELSPGLEKYLNRVAREHKYGTARLPFPIAPVTMSIAGGTTENGGYLSTLYKGLQEKRLKHLIHKDPVLLQPIGLGEVAVINPETGKRCKPYERGIHVTNSPTNQIGYVNEEYNKELTIIEDTGKKWRTTGTPGYIDKYGNLRYLDRPKTDIITKSGNVPLYYLLDPIKRDTKNIMEAYLVKIPCEEHEKYVIHIEMQPDSKESKEMIIEQIRGRIKNIDSEILDNLYFRFRSFQEGFPVAGTGKTDLHVLEKEGLDINICYPFTQNQNDKLYSEHKMLLKRKY